MTGKDSLPASFARYREVVGAELKKVVQTCPSQLGNILKYHMGWQDENGQPCNLPSGKFVRSTLCLLSCQAVGGDVWQTLPAAAAIELVHNFSLIHDDIQDGSYKRHHRPTVWRLWGRSQAINAGDAMFTLAYLAMLGLGERGVSGEKVAGCVRMLSAACLELCEGQYLDLEYESRVDVGVKAYLDMAARKTGALFALSAWSGSYLGSENSRIARFFHLFGRELGIAYQIRDDILGIWGTEQGIGKSASDICRKKKTLPVVYALENSKGASRNRLAQLYSQRRIGRDKVAQVVKTLDDLGARDYAENLAQQHYRKALAHLGAAGLGVADQAPLREIARLLVQRDF